jgi:HAD superfamily hydrolase (TIGR01509 family)
MLIGKSVQSACEALEGVFEEPGASRAIAEELMLLVERAVGDTSRAMDGAVELVTAVAQRVAVAVASNSPRHLLDVALRRAGLTELLPLTVAADEVAIPKPAPDLYEAACTSLGQPPADCLALEDSATGVRSARAAGMRVVVIPTLPDSRLGADAVFTSLADPVLLRWTAGW